MIFLVPVGIAVVIAGLFRIGPRSARRDLPMVWPTTRVLTPTRQTRGGAIGIVLTAFVAGALYGGLGRVWMRLIAADPEFTWSGTLGIMIGFGGLFLGAGLRVAAERRGWRRWPTLAARLVGGLLILPAFTAAGALAFPTVVCAALAIARWDWRLPLRWTLAVVAAVVAVLVMGTIPDDGLPTGQAVLGIVLYPFVLWPLVLAARLPVLPARRPV